MKILVLNAGSSSIKYKLNLMPEFEELASGKIERIGEEESNIKNHHQAVEIMFEKLGKSVGDEKGTSGVDGIGHRVVHGGQKISQPVLIDNKVLKIISENIELAPLHNHANLEGIQACLKLVPGVPQVAVFDTAFHQTLPEYAYVYALPYAFFRELRIRKYGFHGTSHEYIAQQASVVLKKPMSKLKLITCHLGNGCSITAVKNGKSIDTSMGFTPLEGLVMGTRCGDIDPALVIYVMEKLDCSEQKVYEILNKKSGLLGISGISNDVRVLVKNREKSRRARLALSIFTYRIKKYIGSYIYILGGVDAIAFTAGIGENNPWLIKEITRDLEKFLSPLPEILVIPTDEEKMIAQHTYNVIKSLKRSDK